MARKNNPRSEASGSIHFDSRTKTVMAEATHDNIKEKVQAVREVVPGKSNDEVVLVLQYYDYNVERAIQAYLEGGAKEALQEWNFTGTKLPNKKRKNKKKVSGEKAGAKPGTAKVEPAINGKVDLPNGDIIHESQPEAESVGDSSNILPPAAVTEISSATAHSSAEGPSAAKGSSAIAHSSAEGPSAAHSLAVGKSAAKSSSATIQSSAVEPSATKILEAAADSQPQRQPHTKSRGHGDSHHHHQASPRERTISEMSTGSGMGDGHHKKPHQGLEKAIKDLHRQTTSLERLRLLLDHEIDRSIKSVKGVFEELRQGLSSREAQLMAEMDVLKKEASEMLEMRQSKASELRRQVDRSDRLKDSEISDLRAEIKHFVGERRHDEDLGRTTRFLYDSDHMLEEFKKFGEVIHVKSLYTAHRASISSVASSSISLEGNHEDSQPHSQEVHELQDRLKNSLKLQNSSSVEHSSTHSLSTQNGLGRGYVRNRPSQQTPRQPSQSSSSYSRGHLDSQPLDFSSSKPSTSLLPSPASGGSYNESSRRGPPPSHFNNTGSPDRGGRGGYSQSSRGRGFSRGGRGGGYGRGAPRYGGERSRPPSNQGDHNTRMQANTSSSASSNRPTATKADS